MPLIFIILAIILIIFILIHVILLSTGTNIGKKGYKYTLLQYLLYIAEAIVLFAFSFIWMANDSKIYGVFIILLGIILLICGIIGIGGILKESTEDVITETLTDIHITPTGYYNRAVKLEGNAGKNRKSFILRGADKQLVKGEINSLEISYHASNKRIENIEIKK